MKKSSPNVCNRIRYLCDFAILVALLLHGDNSSVEAAKSDPLCFCQDQCSDCECRHIVSVSQNTYNNISILMGGWGWQEYIITPTHTLSHPRKIFIVGRENHNSLIGHNSRFNSSSAAAMQKSVFSHDDHGLHISFKWEREERIQHLASIIVITKMSPSLLAAEESFTRRRLKSSPPLTYGCLDKI